ncbi:pur operon repressor [Granulicatella sp. zg-ZJ]|uniref:pur operon repressor n=1 Tax=unclassified Granulicatella TaxID=2630493 RepID=UPI0013BFCCFF|nr:MULTISPECIES: pur operon repressor [unclassified Granulicatella]MBS4750482.1 pur operon repressor [Carnobacteriaceae bacterium zg-ZUI78]NEW62574.1 pur operon repressor [Granulicatella sp. zg-ZJ]NEW66123.1 pur operon repressor [Granulicatella sp. zg-84]QMI85436.1 pur operon repressor [Carnobacteriaceae bacterium zg-84]
MRVRRTERLIDMTQYLISNPIKLIPLSFFASKYDAAKSSISEDLFIIKETLEKRGTGTVETIPGAAGGARYIPLMSIYDAKQTLSFLQSKLEDPERVLPGNYVYISDLLSDPNLLSRIGKLIATLYMTKRIDVVMTVATKGVPLAQAVAHELGVPFVIVRRDSKVTEGATVSVNYASPTSTRVERMELSKRSLKAGERVLIVDDFLKGGGTVNGMYSLVEEFEAKVAGIAVLIQAKFQGKLEVPSFTSLLKIDQLDYRTKFIKTSLGNYIEKRTK